MLLGTNQLFGRKEAAGFAEESMRRTWEDGERFPTLIFQGRRGSGKTMLLDALAEDFKQGTPYAHIDLLDHERNHGAYVTGVLSEISFQFRKARYNFLGMLKFSRLATGRAVQQVHLGEVEPDHAERVIREQLKLQAKGQQIQ
ncbi:hypothetical protein [Salinactinospora qingdaonensis]|uniref:AAA ATPase domain-containing protein n=1 Tax=Salinactinospora qingdaonensis TaxID=702744 RepID=A0ABP7G3Q8_9ACTN